MSIQIVETCEVVWLDADHALSLTDLAGLSGLSAADVQHLVDCDALPPVAGVEPQAEACFSAQCLTLARTASRLRHDFDLDEDALALTLRLLQRIHDLEAELLHLRAQRPR